MHELIRQQQVCSLQISLAQLTKQVLRLDAEMQEQISDGWAHHHIMAMIVQQWKFQVDTMTRMFYGLEKPSVEVREEEDL